MSKFEELVNIYCPQGVEYKSMDELGFFYGGLSGKTKDDFKNGNAKFITYKNVYSNIALKTDVDDKVRIYDNERQNVIQYGDVLFTGSSETPAECGFSSVLTIHTNEKLYLNSFCFGYRLYDQSQFLPGFLKYLFRSHQLRIEIGKTASGVTRFNVSKKKMGKIKIPIPPIEVQQEIVRILDNFTELTAELTAELEARKKQYEYYRDKLLSFDKPENPNGGGCDLSVEYKAIKDFASVLRGKRVTKDMLDDCNIYPVYHGGLQPLGFYSESNRTANTVMVINVGASAGSVGYCNKDFWSSDGCYCLEHSQTVVDKYLYYVLQCHEDYLKSKVRHAGIPTLDAKVIEDIAVPIPSLEVQQRIVKILDKFEMLSNSLVDGLPAEIEARRKQYEYYRDLLLDFSPESSIGGGRT